jgi:hypothetical protein
MYSAAGFWTEARYEVPVLTVVSNNHNYQTVRHSYARYDGNMKRANRYTGTYLGDPDIDFVKLVQSQGMEGIKVNSAPELPNAIKRGIAATRAGQPFLLTPWSNGLAKVQIQPGTKLIASQAFAPVRFSLPASVLLTSAANQSMKRGRSPFPYNSRLHNIFNHTNFACFLSPYKEKGVQLTDLLAST